MLRHYLLNTFSHHAIDVQMDLEVLTRKVLILMRHFLHLLIFLLYRLFDFPGMFLISCRIPQAKFPDTSAFFFC